jgi:hypothetical protein
MRLLPETWKEIPTISLVDSESSKNLALVSWLRTGLEKSGCVVVFYSFSLTPSKKTVI